MSCQTHFCRGGGDWGIERGEGGSEASFGGGPFWWGPPGVFPVYPALNPALAVTVWRGYCRGL